MSFWYKRSSRTILALVALALPIFVRPAAAYTIPVGTHDGALMSYQGGTPAAPTSIYMSVSDWNTQYYANVPPENNGGLGDGVVCLGLYFGDGYRADGCLDGVTHHFEALTLLEIDDSFPMTFYDHDDKSLGPKTVDLQVTLTGTGAPFPGAGARLNPSPGAEFQYSFVRDAMVGGSIQSSLLGHIDLATAAAVLGHDDCLAIMTGADNVNACRF